MEDNRKVIIRRLFELLSEREFKVSNPDLGGLVSFDLIAKRDDEKYIIKVLHNVDTFRKITAIEMIRISKVTSAASLVIGDRAGTGPLERGVVYYRHRIPIVSLDTFIDYIDGEKPYVYSGPGGFYVSIDGGTMHKIREERGLSIGYVSNKIGTSRRSISLYESGSAATIDIFLKLERLLSEDIRRALDLLEISVLMDMPEEEEPPVDDPFIGEVFSIMIRNGYDFHSMKKSPFDAIANDAPETLFLVGLFESDKSQPDKAIAIRNISDIFGNDPLIISKINTNRELIAGCPVVNLSDLRKAAIKDDLIRLIERRKSVI